MGWVLGAIGGGGGILTVPILVGLFGLTPLRATGASLFIVGVSSSIGAFQGFYKKQIEFRSVLAIAIPSSLTAFFSRSILVPQLPKTIGSFSTEKVMLGLFGVLMFVVAVNLLRKNNPPEESTGTTDSIWLASLLGILIGFVGGVFGAGGGFLIVPVLVLILKVDFKKAVPTSLAVIAFQSLVGYSGEVVRHSFDRTILPISFVAVVGLGLGLLVRNRLPKRALEVGFAILVLCVACWTFLKIL